VWIDAPVRPFAGPPLAWGKSERHTITGIRQPVASSRIDKYISGHPRLLALRGHTDARTTNRTADHPGRCGCPFLSAAHAICCDKGRQCGRATKSTSTPRSGSASRRPGSNLNASMPLATIASLRFEASAPLGFLPGRDASDRRGVVPSGRLHRLLSADNIHLCPDRQRDRGVPAGEGAAGPWAVTPGIGIEP